MKRSDGFALLAVVAVTATLAALVSVVVLSAGRAAAVAGYAEQREQARWLAEAAVAQSVRALADGSLTPPATDSVVVRDGLAAGGRPVEVAVAPAPVADWPRLGPYGDGATRGIEVVLAPTLGPAGEVRGVTGAGDGTRLVQVAVTAWFRRARVELAARIVVHGGGAYRLD